MGRAQRRRLPERSTRFDCRRFTPIRLRTRYEQDYRIEQLLADLALCEGSLATHSGR
jgi:hypothetical protein